ncbi:MAG TPA: hypothetical protein VFN10_10635 [Thermoanaerobaculia bacterium]|nr:hypothetical protein [Thermoanaerobaculia bacterium]
MIKQIAAAASLVLAVACASAPGTSTGTTGNAAVSRSAATATEYVLLSQPNAVRSFDFQKPEYNLHVRGTWNGSQFVPAGSVQGHGQLCSDGKDYLALGELKVYKASEGKTPSAPYLVGCATDRGFVPASREIVTQ